MAIFPSIRPSQRRIVAGDYPTKTYRSLSGAIIKRNFGNRPFGYSLELQFDNRDETTLSLVWDHFHEQNGTSDSFPLSDAIFSGYQDAIITRVKREGTITWYYQEPPQIESHQNGLSSITIRLIGELVS